MLIFEIARRQIHDAAYRIKFLCLKIKILDGIVFMRIAQCKIKIFENIACLYRIGNRRLKCRISSVKRFWVKENGKGR